MSRREGGLLPANDSSRWSEYVVARIMSDDGDPAPCLHALPEPKLFRASQKNGWLDVVGRGKLKGKP